MDIANFKERIAKALAPEVFERAEAAKRRLRPPLETIFQMGYQESEAGVKLPNVPRFKGSYRQLYNVVYSLYILRQVIEKITQETFRNVEDEWEWIPKFAARCAVCGAEYEKEEPEQCEECGSNQFIYPDEKQKELFEEFVEKANANGQSLFDVLREISKDLDIADDAYLVVLKDYVLTHDGHIFQAIPKEILRGSPETFRLVANDDGFPGGRWWKCLHPGCNYVLEEPDREKAKHARCPEHNMILHDVWYVVIDPRKQEKPVRYYLKNEVFHASKHNPTLLYGFSPVITLYSIAEALLAMVGYIRDTYLLERPPKAGLFVQTSNPKSLEKVWDEAMQKKKTNPNYLPVIAIEGEGRTGAQFVSFMDSIEELQYLAVLEEFRRGISAQYGVSLIFQSDTSASGGLNSEGLQITVTNRAVESARTAIQKFIIFLMEQFSITDWMFMLPPVEERDEMAEKQRFAQEVQNATGMLRLGYVPTLEDNLTFSYEYDPDKAKELLGQGDMVMQNPLQIAKPQRMEGEPESMRRSVFGKSDDDIIPDPDRLLIKAYFDQVWEAIHKEDTLWDNYEGLTEAQIEQVNDILAMHFTRPRISLREIMKDLIEIGVVDNQAKMIARTEMTAVVNKAREIDWKEQDPEGKYLYRWTGPNDERTTEICKELTERSRNGLPLNELKTLVREVSKKYLGEEWKPREWVPHIGCRHTFVRKV